MNIGNYILQDRGGDQTFALITGRLKNGSFKVIAWCSWRNRAVCKSTSGWYPRPVVVDALSVPEQALEKIDRHKRIQDAKLINR